jgi:hypothetical protein
MTDAQKVAPDIVTLLAHTWAAQGAGAIDADAIPRIWAYDMGWFDIETARRVRDSLLQTDWLVAADGGLLPGINLEGAEHTFGWMPLMRTLRDPPPCPRESPATESKAVPEIQQASPATQEAPAAQPETTVKAPIDPAAAGIESLLSQVTSSSGLAKKEVLRRAQRKRRALGPITLWMCILLVAREQDLQVGPLVQLLG